MILVIFILINASDISKPCINFPPNLSDKFEKFIDFFKCDFYKLGIDRDDDLTVELQAKNRKLFCYIKYNKKVISCIHVDLIAKCLEENLERATIKTKNHKFIYIETIVDSFIRTNKYKVEKLEAEKNYVYSKVIKVYE